MFSSTARLSRNVAMPLAAVAAATAVAGEGRRRLSVDSSDTFGPNCSCQEDIIDVIDKEEEKK